MRGRGLDNLLISNLNPFISGQAESVVVVSVEGNVGPRRVKAQIELPQTSVAKNDGG